MNRIAFLLTLALGAALAKDPVDPINKTKSGLALKGYDAVAYFTKSTPTKGSPEFTHSWNGATWQFASAANRDSFAQDPTRFAPQFGGYCAWAVSKNYTADADPTAWKIVDGKLYLNYNQEVQKMWSQDIPGRIQAASKNWPTLHK